MKILAYITMAQACCRSKPFSPGPQTLQSGKSSDMHWIWQVVCSRCQVRQPRLRYPKRAPSSNPVGCSPPHGVAWCKNSPSSRILKHLRISWNTHNRSLRFHCSRPANILAPAHLSLLLSSAPVPSPNCLLWIMSRIQGPNTSNSPGWRTH